MKLVSLCTSRYDDHNVWHVPRQTVVNKDIKNATSRRNILNLVSLWPPTAGKKLPQPSPPNGRDNDVRVCICQHRHHHGVVVQVVVIIIVVVVVIIVVVIVGSVDDVDQKLC